VRSFCAECVTEHQAQFLCAACLAAASREGPAARRFRRFLPATLALAGFVFAWFVFYGVGQALLESIPRPESTWQK
jgi:hypothetical protein